MFATFAKFGGPSGDSTGAKKVTNRNNPKTASQIDKNAKSKIRAL